MMESLDLPLIWAGLLALAVFMYVLLDGFDLGLGILFPFAPTDRDRDVMMTSVAPVWDGNETWLVLGGGGLFAVFPKAYAALLPSVYMPIGFMLVALIFRGVAFEFRFKSEGVLKRVWDQAFHWGSVVAAFSQGLILGAIVQGIELENGRFAGGMFDWPPGPGICRRGTTVPDFRAFTQICQFLLLLLNLTSWIGWSKLRKNRFIFRASG